jgi:hypothetical protein
MRPAAANAARKTIFWRAGIRLFRSSHSNTAHMTMLALSGLARMLFASPFDWCGDRHRVAALAFTDAINTRTGITLSNATVAENSGCRYVIGVLSACQVAAGAASRQSRGEPLNQTTIVARTATIRHYLSVVVASSLPNANANATHWRVEPKFSSARVDAACASIAPG